MLEGLAEALKEEAGLALTVHRKPKNTGGEDEIALMLDAVSGGSASPKEPHKSQCEPA